MLKLLLGWLLQVNPTVVLLVLGLIAILVIVATATLTFIVVLGPSDVPTDRVVRILDTIGDMRADTSH